MIHVKMSLEEQIKIEQPHAKIVATSFDLSAFRMFINLMILILLIDGNTTVGGNVRFANLIENLKLETGTTECK